MRTRAYINDILGWDFGRVYIANTFTTLIDRFTSDAFKGFIKLIKFEPAGFKPCSINNMDSEKSTYLKYKAIPLCCQLKIALNNYCAYPIKSEISRITSSSSCVAAAKSKVSKYFLSSSLFMLISLELSSFKRLWASTVL